MPHECANCYNDTNKKCVGCKKVWYCSEKCQRSDWKSHIFDCNRDPSKPIITAYHLYRSVLQNEVPEDIETCMDYGFLNAYSQDNIPKLLGLYIGLLLHLKVEPITLHRWRKQGTLVQEIKIAFEKLQPQQRGGYYPWFLEHQYFLDPSWQPDQDPGEAEIMETWKFVGGDPNDSYERHRAISEQWDTDKQNHFTFYHMIRSGMHPIPDETVWVTLGFAACPNATYERQLAGAYRAIIIQGMYPLSEFPNAFDTGRLLKLFQQHGVGDQVLAIPCMKDFLEDSGIKSVWWLKAYVYQDAGTEQMIPVVRVDYGIVNCAGIIEYLRLMKVTYKEVLEHPEGDPLELHKACITGNLYAYVNGLLKLKKDAKLLKRLMQNQYPLAEFDE